MNGDSSRSRSGTTASDAMNTLLSNTGDGIETTSVIISLYKGVGTTVKKVLSSFRGGGDGDGDSDHDQGISLGTN